MPLRAASPRNPGIDLLRGLSIVLVVLHHLDIRVPLKGGALSTFLSDRVLDAFTKNGYEAVFLFFVVSGFLIASNSLARWGSLGAVRVGDFYRRRAARIVPCFLALVAVLVALHLLGVKGYVITRSGQSLAGAVFSAIFMHLNWYEIHTGYLPGGWDVLWSLSVEEVFYLGFPLVCLVARRKRFLVPLLVLLALSLPFSRAALAGTGIRQEKAYLPGMAAISLGVLGALIAEPLHPNLRVVRLLELAGGFGLAAVLFEERLLWSLFGNGTLLILTLSVLSLVLAFHWRAGCCAKRTLPGTGWLRSFGRLSYEIYLTHMFVVSFAAWACKAAGTDPRWGFLCCIPVVAFSWLLGKLTASFFSLPCEQALKGRFG